MRPLAGAAPILLAACLGCHASPPPRPLPPVSLTGSWTFGEGATEPAPGPVTIPGACWAKPASWTLSQNGDQIRGEVFPGWTAHGAQMAFEPVTAEKTSGRLEGDSLTLTGEKVEGWAVHGQARPGDAPPTRRAPVTYELSYDRESGHLRGTRNDKPFWAAPMSVGPPPTPCPPPPP